MVNLWLMSVALELFLSVLTKTILNNTALGFFKVDTDLLIPLKER